MDRSGRPSIAILGGGMAGLTAAFELSEGNWHDRFERITVYQRGWRLGGKGASSRGRHGRIEEHGLHLLLGYYDHTFDLMRRCYDELDRAANRPSCPILTWDDAVMPANRVGLTDARGGTWLPWIAEFSSTPGMPGSGRSWPRLPVEIATRSMQLLADFFRSLAPRRPSRARDHVYLSASPARGTAGTTPYDDMETLLRGAAVLGLVLPMTLARRLLAAGSLLTERDAGFVRGLEDFRSSLANTFTSDPAALRTLQLVEVVSTNLIGMMRDGILGRDDDFRSIDHLDYREWLLGHGVDPAALESPLLRGMYDLTFAYQDGDPSRPRFSAGLGLQLATRMLLGYSGGLFWKMRSGMGETVFAPLYEVLKRRGVEFRFFHRVDSLRLSGDGRSIRAVEIGIQAQPASGPATYEPLVDVNGLPCWPADPISEQLLDPDRTERLNLESFSSARRDAGTVTLRAGEDFDAIVFGISLGMVPHLCEELIEHSPEWKAMVTHLGTVATQSLQLWLKAGERALGWPGEPGDVVSGFTEPFDTWASMPHVLASEDWPEPDRPRTVAYFCSPLRTGPQLSEEAASDAVLNRARDFLDRDVKALWPGAVGEDGFRSELFCDGGRGGGLMSQYWKANVDPSDLYVQSLPGTDRFRIAPGQTGFDNLAIAGDWTDCGLNAGCLEAATISGQLAAAAVTKDMVPG